MNTPKWIPKHSADMLQLFSDAPQLERELRMLGKKFATNVNLNMPDYYVSFEEQSIALCSITNT